MKLSYVSDHKVWGCTVRWKNHQGTQPLSCDLQIISYLEDVWNMLITILYFKQYSGYLLSTNDGFEVTGSMAELIIALAYESAAQGMVVEM